MCNFGAKIKTMRLTLLALASAALLASCGNPNSAEKTPAPSGPSDELVQRIRTTYTTYPLTTDLNALSNEDKQIIPVLIEAAQIMDRLFQFEAYGNLDSLLATVNDSLVRSFVKVNYGPWDRLDGDKPFIEGVGEKPLTANFYPHNMTKAEFEAWDWEHKKSLYTIVRRNADGTLKGQWFHEAFATDVERAAKLLEIAESMSTNTGFKKYLEARAKALRTDDYMASDLAWMDMRDNSLDFIVGPIENYEDKLYGYKAAHEAYVLVRDKDWSARLARYASLLPQLQKGLPVDAKYKQEKPGSDSQLGAYDVIYYAGDCNAGSKTIAVNLPNDEEVQLKKGTRRLQLKNAMRAKYDRILVPIANELIAADQMQHITFEAFFGNTMFHEVAHGLGIKNTINGKGTVREALEAHYSALEEGKADILGLYMESELYRMGELKEGSIMDSYVTFLAGIFRSVRFGASSAHGKANMLRFNYFKEKGAFTKGDDGKYRVNPEQMAQAVKDLSALILQLQGDGDQAAVVKLMNEKGAIGADLKADLDRLASKNIPVDVVFEQGLKTLGLSK